MSRTIAIGDIHGCLTALEILLEHVVPTIQDTIIALGDYVDRGDNSRGVIDRMIALHHNCNLIALRGNHDIMMMDARFEMKLFRLPSYRSAWEMSLDGDATIASYGGSAKNVPTAHWRFLEQTLPYYETDTHIFVHAGADSKTSMTEQTAQALYWDHLQYPKPHCSGKTMIVGHSAQKNGLPRDFGHTICIDTWACGGQWLSCLDIDSGQIIQASEAGDTRVLWREKGSRKDQSDSSN